MCHNVFKQEMEHQNNKELDIENKKTIGLLGSALISIAVPPKPQVPPFLLFFCQ